MSSDEDLRRAIELSLQDVPNEDDDDDADLRAAIEASLQTQYNPTPAPAAPAAVTPPAPKSKKAENDKFQSGWCKDEIDTGGEAALKKQKVVDPPLKDLDLVQLDQLVWGPAPIEEDISRWRSQGFTFCENEACSYNLVQSAGGPCGVLAPVNAFILRFLFFVKDPETVTPSVRMGALIDAVSFIYYRATSRSHYTVVVPDGDSFSSVEFEDIKQVQRYYAANTAVLTGRSGILGVVYSALVTRGFDALKEDMDDPETVLIGRFGHCSQELVNLMLIGRAYANVFDGTQWLGNDPSTGLLLHGIPDESEVDLEVGYLSEVESLRYVTVGARYKNPLLPLWVLGSATHYTLLYSKDQTLSNISPESKLETQAYRVFDANSLDPGNRDCGAAQNTSIAAMVTGLQAHYALTAEDVRDAVEWFQNEPVVLWSDFHSWCCRRLNLAQPAAKCKRFDLFHYDGQMPPGPALRKITVEHSDLDSQVVQADRDVFSAALQTRWPDSIITIGDPI